MTHLQVERQSELKGKAASEQLAAMAEQMELQEKKFATLVSRYKSLESDYRHVIDLLQEKTQMTTQSEQKVCLPNEWISAPVPGIQRSS